VKISYRYTFLALRKKNRFKTDFKENAGPSAMTGKTLVSIGKSSQ